jgi:hypothetical protein
MMVEDPYLVAEHHLRAALDLPHPPGHAIVCPKCGGRLILQFDLYYRAKRRMIGASAWCEDCELSLSLDLDGSNAPPWLVAPPSES